jgi:hypothetical protein
MAKCPKYGAAVDPLKEMDYYRPPRQNRKKDAVGNRFIRLFKL